MGFGHGYFFDPITLIVGAITAMIAGAAAAYVKGTIHTWQTVPNRNGMTGKQVAQRILDAEGIRDVRVESVPGFLTDHYSPSEKVLRLSPAIGDGTSVSSLAVAAHEVGHAIQHARSYPPLGIRSLTVPAAQYGPMIAVGLLLPMGAMLQSPLIIKIGLILFSMTVLFALVTLPVEFDASRRALNQIDALGLASAEQHVGARKVLTAAALTYVAAAVAALIWLLVYAYRYRHLLRR